MPIHFPPRRYLNFAELQLRWQCEANDIRALVCAGDLVPSIHVSGRLLWAEWVDDLDERVSLLRPKPDGMHAIPRTRGNGDHWAFELNEWLYPRFPTDIGPFNCVFDVLSTDPLEAPEAGLTVADWYLPDRSPSLEDVERSGVFMLTEVARVEAAGTDHGRVVNHQIHPREETTYLNIIGGLLAATIGQSIGGQKLSVYNDQTALLDALIANHPRASGMSRRKLETVFAEAKRSLSDMQSP